MDPQHGGEEGEMKTGPFSFVLNNLCVRYDLSGHVTVFKHLFLTADIYSSLRPGIFTFSCFIFSFTSVNYASSAH